MSGNPPVPRRSKPSEARHCPPASTTQSSKDSSCHSYYVYSAPPATTEVNRLPAGRNTRSGIFPRSESLNNVGSSSPSRKTKSASGSNNNSNNSRNSGAGRLWRHYSVGDILYKLQSVVSSGFSLPRGLVRSMSRFSVSHSANPSSPSKVSPDRSTSDGRFFSPGLKQRSASEILHRSPQPEDVIPPKSPTPEKEAPPLPPPRLVVRQKPAAKMKVFIKRLLDEFLLLINCTGCSVSFQMRMMMWMITFQ